MKILAIIKTLIKNDIEIKIHEGYSIVKTKLTPTQYINTYKDIGEKYCWWMKQLWSDEQLQEHLDIEGNEAFWIVFNQEIIGFCEIQNHNSEFYYLQYFGLYENYIGKGHGIKSLDTILNYCSDKKVFTTTNNLDHENALNVYTKCGFTEYSSHEEVWNIPENKVKITLTERNARWLL